MVPPVWLIAGLTSFGIAKLSGASTKKAIMSGILGGATAGIFGPGSQGSKDLVMSKAATDAASKSALKSLPQGMVDQGLYAAGNVGNVGSVSSAFVAPDTTSILPSITYDNYTGQVLGDSGNLARMDLAKGMGVNYTSPYPPSLGKGVNLENIQNFSGTPEPSLFQKVVNYGKDMSTPTKVGLGVSALTLAAQPKTPDKKPSLYESQEYKDLVTSERAKANKQIEGITTARTYTEEDDAMPDLYNYNNNMMYANQGGIVNIMPKYNEGGINYLPSKMEHDEKDVNNYVRASGYVEDGTGVGDKDEDTMLAQLADGEFVSRADAILGAGIMAGADPKDMKEMRKKGAAFFYSQQDSLKRVYDLIN